MLIHHSSTRWSRAYDNLLVDEEHVGGWQEGILQVIAQGDNMAVMDSEDFYKQGNECRRRGDFGAAINCYIKAIELDPDSPAVEAKSMLEDILNFYNKDAYNP